MAVLPVVRGFIGGSGAQEDRFGEWSGSDLQAHGKAGGVETAGERDRRQAGQVIRIGQAPGGGERAFLATGDGDVGLADARCGDGFGGTEDDVGFREDAGEVLLQHLAELLGFNQVRTSDEAAHFHQCAHVVGEVGRAASAEGDVVVRGGGRKLDREDGAEAVFQVGQT